MPDFKQTLQQAYNWGVQKHPGSNPYRHCSFANSVSYLVTGMDGGYGGPSIREHAVHWSLSGNSDHSGAVPIADDRLPLNGTWTLEKACEFAAPIVYGDLPAIASQIHQSESCFDDDPEDLVEIKKS